MQQGCLRLQQRNGKAKEEEAYVNALMSSPMELQVLDAVCTHKHRHRQANHAAMRMF